MAVEALDPGAALLAHIGRRADRGKRRLVRSWPLVWGAVLLAIIGAACIAAPLLTSWITALDPNYVTGAPPLTPGHLLGVDAPYGRDILSRILYGGRVDLAIGLGGTAVTVVVGTAIRLSRAILAGNSIRY